MLSGKHFRLIYNSKREPKSPGVFEYILEGITYLRTLDIIEKDCRRKSHQNSDTNSTR